MEQLPDGNAPSSDQTRHKLSIAMGYTHTENTENVRVLLQACADKGIRIVFQPIFQISFRLFDPFMCVWVPVTVIQACSMPSHPLTEFNVLEGKQCNFIGKVVTLFCSLLKSRIRPLISEFLYSCRSSSRVYASMAAYR